MGEEENKEKKPDQEKEGGDGEKDKKDEAGGGEAKKAEEAVPPPPPPPPEEVVMTVHMHCEGCARKVRRCLRGFEGVEAVIADCMSHRVVVKGKKAAEDPMKVVERVHRKSGRKVELISPLPPPPPEAEKEEEKEKPNPNETLQVITVVLRVHMHCEACAQEIKKRVLRMKGVQEAEAELKSSEVTVKGVFEPTKLAEYVHRRTGKHAVVVKQEPPPPPPPEENQEKKTDEEKQSKEGEGDQTTCKDDKDRSSEEEKKEDGGGTEQTKEKSTDGGAIANAMPSAAIAAVDTYGKMIGLMRMNDLYYYYPRYQVEYAYPPQIFSDENPNACTVM